MRKILTFITLITFLSCSSQNLIIKDFSDKKDINYIFARINLKNIISKELYDRGIFIKIFEISDSKVTPDKEFDGTEEFFSSYIISVTPDGDYYSGSKLYKVEGLLNPEIIEIQEETYPNFIINLEYGALKNRKIKAIKFEGIK